MENAQSNFSTNFKNVIPTIYKFGLVYTLLDCSLSIASISQKLENEIDVLTQNLKLRGCPF